MTGKKVFRQNYGAIKTMLLPLRYFLFNILNSNHKQHTVDDTCWNLQQLFCVGFFYFRSIKVLRSLGYVRTVLLYVPALDLAASKALHGALTALGKSGLLIRIFLTFSCIL